MSATNLTKNLKLSQFLASDKPSWLGDVNGDNKKIDDGYGVLAGEISKANDTASSAKSQSDANTQTLTNVNSELEDYGNRITALEAGGGTEQLEQRVNTLTTDVESLQTRANTFEEKIESNESNITSLTTSLNTITPKVNANEQNITRLNSTTQGLTESVESTSRVANNALQTATSANTKATQAQTNANNANASVEDLSKKTPVFDTLRVFPNLTYTEIGNEERINILLVRNGNDIYFNFLPFAFKIKSSLNSGTALLTFDYNSSYTVDETSVGSNQLIYCPSTDTMSTNIYQLYWFNDSDTHKMSLIFYGNTISSNASVASGSAFIVWRCPSIHFTTT